MGIPPDSEGTKGSGAQVVGAVHTMEVDHSGEVHRHLAHHGPLYGFGEAPRG